MAKQRTINTKFWSDPWINEILNPLDRYLFLYFLTNERTNISGIYELPLSVISFETGLEKETLLKTMIPRLSPKVIYANSWVILPNFPKHQNLNSPDVQKGIHREFDSLPEQIKQVALGGGWGDGLGMVSGTKPNLTKPTGEAKLHIIPEKAREKKVTHEMQEVFDLFSFNPARFVWKGRVHQRDAAAVLHKEFGIVELRRRLGISQKYRKEPLCPQINDPSDFLEKMPKMENFLNNL